MPPRKVRGEAHYLARRIQKSRQGEANGVHLIVSAQLINDAHDIRFQLLGVHGSRNRAARENLTLPSDHSAAHVGATDVEADSQIGGVVLKHA